MARLIVPLLLLFAMLPCRAGEPTYLTWVRQYQVQPGHEDEFVPLIRDTGGATLDKLCADGKVLSWGIVTPLTHREPEGTHSMWISFPNWESTDVVMDALMADQAARGPEQLNALRERVRAIIDERGTRDDVFRQVVVVPPSGTPASKPPAYLRVAWYKIRPQQEVNAKSLYQKKAAPVYGDLMSSGSVLAAGFARRELTPDSDSTHITWAVLTELSALDGINAALEKLDAEQKEKQQPALNDELEYYFDMDAYRSQLFLIIHSGGTMTPSLEKPQ